MIVRPVSLGNTCETKFQLSRIVKARSQPGYSLAKFRLDMLPPARRAQCYGEELFDWHGTPFETVRRYLEGDFVGFFEQDDLEPVGGTVIHRRYGTDHMHQFEPLLKPERSGISQETIAEDYPAARARFDRLVDAFRKHLRSAGDFLYVHCCEDFPTRWPVEGLLHELTRHHPGHKAHLLLVGLEGEDADLAMFPNVTKAWRPRTSGKPPEREWEGNDEAWDKALERFVLAELELAA
jgi:hypothetical protein